MSAKGRQFPSEITQSQDERTGAKIWQVTNHPSINHHLYFLTCSFTPDEKAIVFSGFRSGTPNFYKADFPEGSITQLTDAPGVNSFSGCLSPDGLILFFTQEDRIMALDMQTLSERIVAEFPGAGLGEVDCSHDGKWLVTAARFVNENAIAIAATDGSSNSILYRQKHTIVHPQFHPSDADWIEYAQDPAPRMHVIRRDGSQKRCLHQHENAEYVVHETWLGTTGDIVYTYWPYSVRRVAMPSGKIETIAEFNAWHISPSRDGKQILCDTNHPDIGLQLLDTETGHRATICFPSSSNAGSQWTQTRYAEKADFEAAARAAASDVDTESSWMEMKTDTVYGPQWTHPHPSFSPTNRYAAFTSDRTGHSQVYVVELPLEPSWIV